ncbi:MAG: heavy-metal-associated domain-containing protein [Candidatus Levybacteria bacterium]|nr:heavy-metal-associated domain-containing protein [Candidatus Levybacteria bacterium]MBI2421000.1 heavy-metal-associated domain-containing protein [Candidatus Levybacteria bacterium]
MIKKIYKITGMHCTSCAMDIDGELEDNGAIEAKTSYARAITEVKFDPEKIKEERIISIINNLGYNVETI